MVTWDGVNGHFCWLKSGVCAYHYGYNGKEKIGGTGLYAYGFRYYDPLTARFTGVDPISDQFAFVSVYNYAESSPVRYIDLHGLQKAEPESKQGLNLSSGTGVSPITIYNSQLRINYSNASAALEPFYSPNQLTAQHSYGVMERTALKESTRSQMIGGRAHLDAADPIKPKFTSSVPGKPNPRFFNTNSGVNTLSKVARKAGIIGVGFTIYDLHTAAQEGRFIDQAQVEVGKLGGAWAGMKVFGAAAAASPDPYTKTPVGAIIVVGAGGVIGSVFGEQGVIYVKENIKFEPPKRTGMGYTTCFVAGTKVSMANLMEKNIEDVKEGDLILSVNTTTMAVDIDTVTLIPAIVSTYKKIVIELEDSTIIEFSPAHPFWIEGKGWSVFDLEEAKTELSFDVNRMEVGDYVLRFEKNELKRLKIRSLYDSNQYVKMYNLENVAKNHSFFANKILVHNKRL